MLSMWITLQKAGIRASVFAVGFFVSRKKLQVQHFSLAKGYSYVTIVIG